MKRYIYFIALFFIGIIWAGCEKEFPKLGTPPTEADVQFTFEYDANNPNIVYFKSQSPGFIAKWDLGNGTTVENAANTKGAYPVKGEYKVTLTIFTDGGSASSSKMVTIANTNPMMLNREDYNLLSGGANVLEGKTWVVAKDVAGHLGVGPVTGTTPEWYSAGANEKASEGLYDDEITFKLNEFEFIYDNKGATFANKEHVTDLGGSPAASDATVNYTPKTGTKWDIIEEDGKKFITITDGGFFGYYTGISRYEIITLGENELYVKHRDSKNADLAWYQRFVPKGYIVPPVEKPYRTGDLFDNFDLPGNVAWKSEQVIFDDNYDNPASFGINSTRKVGRYEKGAGDAHAFDNLYVDLDYRIDLTQRNVFVLKVYLPSYNDYTTEAGFDWASNKRLAKQVAIKLQNSQAGEPWVSQAEVVGQVTKMNEWVELTFDFSAHADRKDFDRIVLQVGGEANFIPGVFFIDDFQLLP